MTRALLLAVVFGAYLNTCVGFSPGANNVCGYFWESTRCCDGWTKNLDGLCTIAICAGNCGDRGRCVSPNLCKCEDGQLKLDCLSEDDFDYLADEPVRCPSNCNKQGSCLNGKCVCKVGFSGSSCEEEELGLCYAQIDRGVCSNKVTAPRNQTTLLTQNICCGSVGKAWGNPCQSCQGRHSYCGRGYTLVDHKCVDINECDIPGVCLGGMCRNTEGSFECGCSYGYTYNPITTQCEAAMDACKMNTRACTPGGHCIPQPGNKFTCQCNIGYRPTNGNTHCQKVESTINYCEIFEGKLCENGECLPTHSSYECACHPGFRPSYLKKQCIKDFDACSLYGNSVCDHGQCVPFGRSFRCKCNTGYILSAEGTACIDRCQQLGQSVCPNGYCVTRPYGDYECKCHLGFTQSADRKSCQIRLNPKPSQNRRPWGTSNFYRSPYQSDWPEEVPGLFAKDGMTKQIPRRAPEPNACHEVAIRRRCTGGFCVNLGRGAYECKCFMGYRAVNGNQQCIPNHNIQSKYAWEGKLKFQERH